MKREAAKEHHRYETPGKTWLGILFEELYLHINYLITKKVLMGDCAGGGLLMVRDQEVKHGSFLETQKYTNILNLGDF